MLKVPQKHHVTECSFLINNIDILHTTVLYDYFTYTSFNYKNNKKEKIKNTLLEFQLEGEDINERHGAITFQIKMLPKDLKELPFNEIIDITDYLSDMEPYYYTPEKDYYNPMYFKYPNNDEDDMFNRFTSLYVYRKDVNKFIFKLDNSRDNIFAAFVVEISET